MRYCVLYQAVGFASIEIDTYFLQDQPGRGDPLGRPREASPPPKLTETCRQSSEPVYAQKGEPLARPYKTIKPTQAQYPAYIEIKRRLNPVSSKIHPTTNPNPFRALRLFRYFVVQISSPSSVSVSHLCTSAVYDFFSSFAFLFSRIPRNKKAEPLFRGLRFLFCHRNLAYFPSDSATFSASSFVSMLLTIM